MMGMVTQRSLLALGLLSLVSPTMAADSDWKSKTAKGITEAWVNSGPTNRVLVTCTKDDGEPVSGISFSVDGETPPPNSTVTMIFDGKNTISVTVDELGVLDTDCEACAEDFIKARDALKSGETVTVRFPDKSEASFPLAGSSEAIGTCTPDYDSGS